MEDELYLLIEVEGVPGLDNISLNTVNKATIEEITPILLEIYENNGWFPTGDFLYPALIGPTPWEIYGKDDPYAFETLLSLMPNPEAGFRSVVKVLCWRELDTMSLIM